MMKLTLTATLLSLVFAAAAQDACILASAGTGDDAPALLAAVASCSKVTVPAETTLNISTRLDMTGLQDVHIDLQGTISFFPDIPYWSGNAFMFDYQDASTGFLLGGQNVLLDGGGTLDGSGQDWYDAFHANSSLIRPIILTVYQGTNITVQNITMLNSPQWVNLVYESQDVVYSDITITSSSSSDNDAKNTDGWDTYRSDNVVIKDSVIHNGDDCVSFKPNSTNILVSNLDCTGSHGISVGSLGQYAGAYDIVENVTAIDIKMADAQNGARIKAWAGANVGAGIVRNITYKNWVVDNVELPIVIDQCYMTDADECEANPSNTYIEDIIFTNITGTASEETVASLVCSPDGRCGIVEVSDFDVGPGSGDATYDCSNIEITGNSASLFPDECQA